MNRTEFLDRLEYLLQDIPEEEKAEAIAYYRDYLEDAGDENEEQAIRDFGSPERVAAIIRSDLSGNLEGGGEFTEAGYQDERFRDPNYQMVKRRDLPETQADTAENPKDEQQGHSDRRKPFNDTMTMRVLKVGLLLVGLAVLAPIVLGLGGGVIGILAGVLALVVAALILVGVLTLTACVGAVALLIQGAGMLFSQPWAGALVFGTGILVLGLALIGVALSILVYGRFLPYCIRGVIGMISRLFHRERRNTHE